MNLPNQLTVLRLILTFAFLGVMTLVFPHSKTLALIVFSVAAITDFLDGYLARKHNLITNFGKLMDPLADKVLMAAGFVMLCEASLIPGWVVVVIVAREFMVTGLRLVASAEGKVLPAEKLGKYKTTIQIVAVIYFLFLLAATEPGSILGFMEPLFSNVVLGVDFLGQVLIWGAMFLTLLSGVNYVLRNRDLLSDF